MLLNFVRILAVANSLSLLFGSSPWHTGTSGTFDTALIAITVPLFVAPHWYMALVLLLGAIVEQGEGTAIAVLLAQAVCYFFIYARAKIFFITTVLCSPFLYFVPWKAILVSHSLRLKMWATYLGHWWDYAPIMIGFGDDTFRFRAPRLPVEGQNFTWAHNDYLEILFEHGVIGFVFALCALFYMMKIFRHHKHFFCATTGFAVCMLFYSPLQVVTGQLILAALIWELSKIARR